MDHGQHALASGQSTVNQAGRDVVVNNYAAGPPTGAWNVPPRNPNFVGRVDALATLDGLAVQTVRGMGGVGKTQLAVEYCYQNSDSYDVVWWIFAENRALIPDQLHLLGKALRLDLPADTRAAVPLLLSHLRNRGRCLLVFDNAESVHDIRDYLPWCRVLVTTRRAGFDALGDVLDLDTFTRPESITLLRQRAMISEGGADDLAVLLGDLPLGLEQAAAYLKQTGMPVDEYLNLLRSNPELMAGQGVDGHRPASDSTLATVWTMSFTRLDPRAATVLQVCGYLGPEAIPLSLFDEFGSPSMAVAPLVDYSLAQRVDDRLVMHRMVQLAARRNAEDVAWPSPHPLVRAATLLSRALPRDHEGPESWPVWRILLPHVLTVLGHDLKLGLLDGDLLVRLLDQAGAHLQDFGEFDKSRELLERALLVAEGAACPDHRNVGTILNNLAAVFMELSRPADALPLLERSLDIAESAGGRDCFAIGSILNNLGLVQRDLGDLVAAREWLERALAADQADFGAAHPQVAIVQNNLALVLTDLGDLVGARRLLEEALRVGEATLAPGHPAIATRLNNLGLVLGKLGDLAMSRMVLERALVMDEASFGPVHPTIATRLRNLAGILRKQGLAAEARPLLDRAGEIDDRLP
ncbi:tetratricopeptide repeat protein [Umezawaea endophytica]|uniref:Tetratricopeptide repeat protein n=1 Tax=Umezawaea endophytica TaxID=1654476 RepID=A0A9X3AHR0_9PSEU|nr:tetratricopeptide repeat protein [Umezawaea endophytica]MCS7481441.1 tetratricopeptide repeat protein [Umezawaea endophytica]